MKRLNSLNRQPKYGDVKLTIVIESATTLDLAAGAGDTIVIVSEGAQPYNYLYMAIESPGIANPSIKDLMSALSISQTTGGSLSLRFDGREEQLGFLPLWCNLGWANSDDCAGSCSYDAAGDSAAANNLVTNPSRDAEVGYFYLPVSWRAGQADTLINITAGANPISVRFGFCASPAGMRGAFRVEEFSGAGTSQMFLPQDGEVQTALAISTTGTYAAGTFAYQARDDITNVSLSGVQRLTWNFPKFTLAGQMDAYIGSTSNGDANRYSAIAANIFPRRSADFRNQPYIRQVTTAGTSYLITFLTAFRGQ